MIIELCEWLVEKGLSDDLSDEIHDLYLEGGIEKARSVGIEGTFDGDEIEGLIREWQIEVGEA